MIEKFSDVATAQEKTAQKSFDMKMKRLEMAKETDIAKIKAQERIQMGKDKHKAELRLEKIRLEREKMRMNHELQLARMNPNGPYINAPLPSFPQAPEITVASSPTSTPSSSANLGFDLGDENSFSFSDFSANSIGASSNLYLPRSVGDE